MDDCFFFQNNTGLIITMNNCWVFKCSISVLNGALRYRAFWLANEIAINSASHVDKATEFWFLGFHEIIGLSFANLKQYPLMLFLSPKLAQSASQNPSNFKGFCNFLNISDWLIVPFKWCKTCFAFFKLKEFCFARSWDNFVYIRLPIISW